MKIPFPFARTAALVGLLPLTTWAAQSTVDQPIELSPFVVNTERDTGFAAASSLAGGRLSTDLRDTPVAYSVVTREFIDALDLVDLQSAAVWITGATEALDNGGNAFNGVTTQYSIRGNGNTTPLRNFFPINYGGDNYNVERIDFGRGPNSILFGNGSMGGVSTSTTRRPQFDRPFLTVQASAGSFQYLRGTVDVNQPVGKKAAIRLDAVSSYQRTWRQSEFRRLKSLFASARFKPYKGAEIRVDAERGQDARQQAGNTIQDLFSGWDGVTVFNAPAAAATLPSNANALGVSRRGANYYVYDPTNPTAAIMNYQNDPITLGGGATNTTPIGGYVQGALPSFNTNAANILYAINVPANRFDTALSHSAFRMPSEGFTNVPDAPVLTQHYHDLQVTINQQIGNLFIEAAADRNTNKQFINGESARGTNNTYLDINRVRPDGSPNPNFLQPYGDGSFQRGWKQTDFTNARLAAAYVHRTTLGTFLVNAMGGINKERDFASSRYLSLAQGDDHRQWGFLSSPGTQLVRIRRYWYAQDRSLPDPSLNPVQFIDPVTRTNGTIQPRWVIDTTRRTNETINDYSFKYVMATTQAKLFKDHLIVLGGLRYDKYSFYSKQQRSYGDYPTNWDGNTPLYRPDAPADFDSLTYRVRDSAGNPTGDAREAAIRPRDSLGNPDPRYASDRFKDDYNSPTIDGGKLTKSVGSVFHWGDYINPSINYAETFNPPLNIVRIDGSHLKPTIASGLDYSWRFELLDKRLDLNFTYFTSKEINGIISGNGPNYFNTLYDAAPLGAPAGSRNTRGAGDVPSDYRDTRTRTGSGYEVEVVANLNKALRLMGSISFPRIYESNMNPDVTAYIDKNMDLFKQVAKDAGVLVDANNVAAVDTSIPINQRSPDANNVATAFNNIVAFRQNIISGKRITQNQPVANLFVDYSFQDHGLKGLRVGLGVQYRAKFIIGYRGADTIVDPNNPTKAIDDPTRDAKTPLYTPNSYTNFTGNLSYQWRFKSGRTLLANLVINNLTNKHGPIWVGGSTAMRPKNNDFTSPAREIVPFYYSLRDPINFRLSVTLKL